MKSKIFLILLVLLSSVGSVFGQPKLSYKDYGGEPCEYCQYGNWTVTKLTNLYEQMSEDSPFIFFLNEGEKVTAVTGVVITTKTGLGKALENTYLENYNEENNEMSKVPIKKNEKFYLLTYQGEDVYKVWYNGQILTAKFDEKLSKISRPESIWWVKIKNSIGQVGWTNQARNFDGEHPY